MILEDLADDIFETDVLIVGGGCAGTVAAIRAKENKNIDVTLIDKAAIKRSGDAGRGMDHYAGIAHPEINGVAAEDYGRMRAADFDGLASIKLSTIVAKDALKPLALLEDIGVQIRQDDGTLAMCKAGRLGGGMTRQPGEKTIGTASDFLLYRGADLKIRLASEVRKRKVRVLERTMLTSLITTDGSVVGATAVNVRNGKFIVFKAKSVLLATGGMQPRMYGYPFAAFPNNLFTSYNCPTNCGSGVAVAYRAGARLTNMEFTSVNVKSHGWVPSTQSSVFHGKMKNSKGELLFAKYPEIREKQQTGGFTPWDTYCFKPNMSDPEIERDIIMYYWDGVPESGDWHGSFMAANETPFVLKMNRDRGGSRNAPYQLYPWLTGPWRSFSGILFDESGKTSLDGLYVAGDVMGGIPGYGCTGAFVWGYRIGDFLRESILETEGSKFDGHQMDQVLRERDRIRAPMLSHEEGVDPLELEDLVRKTTSEFVGIKKSEPRLERAVELIGEMKERFVPSLAATNPHELMRALEVQDILDLSKIHAQAALIRKESRLLPNFYRVDYPEKDDTNWRKNIVLWAQDDKLNHTTVVRD